MNIMIFLFSDLSPRFHNFLPCIINLVETTTKHFHKINLPHFLIYNILIIDILLFVLKSFLKISNIIFFFCLIEDTANSSC